MSTKELEEFRYDHDGLSLTGLVAIPDGPGPFPAVLIYHAAFGLDHLVKSRASDLAELGYLALAIDMYGTGPGMPALGAEHHQHFMSLQESPSLLRARAVAPFEALRVRTDVDSGKIAAIGYCFGGQCAMELARSGADIRAAVSFHGLLAAAIPAKPGEVKAKLLAMTGAHDPFVSADAVAEFQREMTEAQANWQVTVYGEGYHSFTDKKIDTIEVPGMGKVPGTKYDPFLDRLSWAQATTLLKATTLDA